MATKKVIKEETSQKEKEKILRAIWIHNKLIDDYPEIYKYLKEIYEEARYEHER
jgi:hypothetical protein